MSRILFLLFILPLWVLPAPAEAHPHVWVTYKMKVIGGKDGVQKIRFVWNFDAMFTDMVKEEFHLKTIGAKESKILETKAFANLKNYHYYMRIDADGKEFLPGKIEDFSAVQRGKNLEYTFTISLPQPARKMDVAIWDDEFYVDLDPPTHEVPSDKPPGFMSETKYEVDPFITVEGTPAPVCASQQKDRNSQMWGKFITFTVECTAGS